MNNNNIIKNALISAAATAAYVVAIASFLTYAPNIFGPDEGKTMLIPIIMLLLLVFSAALTGFLVFGRPVMLYLDGKKTESIQLLGYTLGVLLAFIIAAILILYFDM